MANTWVLVADEAKARLFSYQPRGRKLEEFESHAHPESRLAGRDLQADRPGRAFDSAGEGRHAMGQPNDALQEEALRFARTLAGRLESGRTGHDYDQLMVVAPPSFLGVLRETFNGELRKLVTHEAPKNVVHMGAEDILRQLPH